MAKSTHYRQAPAGGRAIPDRSSLAWLAALLLGTFASGELWAMAAEKAQSFDVQKVIEASSELAIDAPEGSVKFHKDNHHLWKHARIGEFLPDGQAKMLYESDLIEPDPFPKL